MAKTTLGFSHRQINFKECSEKLFILEQKCKKKKTTQKNKKTKTKTNENPSKAASKGFPTRH